MSDANQIPLMDLSRQYLSVKEEVDAAVRRIIDTTSFIGGPDKDGFEKDFAQACGVNNCVGVGNGTDSLFLILKAMGIGAGDEVITAANSFIASSEAITLAGARVVFADADERTFNIDLDHVERLLSTRAASRGGKIKAVMPVHLYGRICDMPRLMKLADQYGVKVIEDSAQAHLAEIDGKRAGAWGDAGSFSFYPGKNLGAFGDAGAVVSKNEELAQLVRKIANHGRIKKYDHDMEGTNSRLDTLQAAVLRVKLKRLAEWSKLRYEKALTYDKLLGDNGPWIKPEIPARGQHVFHLYVIRVPRRDRVLSYLNEHGIGAGVHYPVALPNLSAYSYLGHKPEDFPVATQLAGEILSLPLFPEMTDAEQTRVVETLKQAIAATV